MNHRGMCSTVHLEQFWHMSSAVFNATLFSGGASEEFDGEEAAAAGSDSRSWSADRDLGTKILLVARLRSQLAAPGTVVPRAPKFEQTKWTE